MSDAETSPTAWCSMQCAPFRPNDNAECPSRTGGSRRPRCPPSSPTPCPTLGPPSPNRLVWPRSIATGSVATPATPTSTPTAATCPARCTSRSRSSASSGPTGSASRPSTASACRTRTSPDEPSFCAYVVAGRRCRVGRPACHSSPPCNTGSRGRSVGWQMLDTSTPAGLPHASVLAPPMLTGRSFAQRRSP